MHLDSRCSRIKVFLFICCFFSEWCFIYLYMSGMIYSTEWDVKLFILAHGLRNKSFYCTVEGVLLQQNLESP